MVKYTSKFCIKHGPVEVQSDTHLCPYCNEKLSIVDPALFSQKQNDLQELIFLRQLEVFNHQLEQHIDDMESNQQSKGYSLRWILIPLAFVSLFSGMWFLALILFYFSGKSIKVL